MAHRVLELYYDIVCPYAYLAFTQVAALAEEAGCELVLHPVLLGGVLVAHGTDPQPMDAMSPNKARLNTLDALRQAERLGEPLTWPAAHPRRTVDALRVIHAAPQAARVALSLALYRAYWVEGRDVASLDVLDAIAAPFGVDARAACADPEVRGALRAETDAAAARGVFGVPTFAVGDELWWGADRIAFARMALGLSAPDREPRPATPGARVTFFHDFSSPFSYLASARIGRLAAERGAEIEWVPFLLGALFQSLGGPLVPIQTFSAPRQAWVQRDLQAWAARYDVPFRFTSHFPLRTVTALRMAIAEPALTAPLYRAAWAEDRDLSDADVLRGVADDAGHDGAAILARTREPEVKAALFANTARAEASGACGAPTCQVGDSIFWGQDRLDMVAAALEGWVPRADGVAP